MPKNPLLKITLDHIGISVSLLCAIHCGILPFLLILAPLASLEFLHEHWLENSIIGISMCIAVLSLAHGYFSHHKRLVPIWIVLAGFVFIFLGHSIPLRWSEIAFSSLGATAVAWAHVVNWKLVRKSH